MNADRFCQACNRETSQYVVKRGPHAGWWCRKCNNICTDSPLWLSDAALHAMGLVREILPDAPATTLQLPLPNVGGKSNPACRRCGVADRLETHHWAPRAVFGDDADKWPTDDLCVPCHQEWHSRMHDHARALRAAG